VPIIVVSSGVGESEAVAAMRAGAHDYVTKHSVVRLVPAIQRALGEREMRRARRRAEAELRVSEERFTKAFEYAPIGMALVTVDGRILKVNRALGAMFGYAESEMRTMRVWEITHPDDMPATIEQMQRLLDDEIDTWFLEKRYFHRDGHPLWGRSTTWLVRDADGEPRYVVSQVQDITELKRIEDRMRQQQAELAHVLRVATMGETLAQIAHEVNQPLASIANYANGLIVRLDRDAVDTSTIRAIAERIADEALRATDVIRRLREFLRKGEPKRARCDANDIVRDAIRLADADLRQHAVHLDLALAPGPLTIGADRIQIEQVVLNLLRNAIEAMLGQPNGRRTLTVTTERGPADQVAVRVCDSGIGFAAATDGRIFDPFYTTKEGGLGLGLSISRSIVEAHGGVLRAARNDDGGATVGFTLPAA
jgi:PAS domain S-box-containing protein